MNKLFTREDLWGLKYMITFLMIIYFIFLYAGLAGWKFFGTDTEKWSAEGPGSRPHHSGSHFYTNRSYYHK